MTKSSGQGIKFDPMSKDVDKGDRNPVATSFGSPRARASPKAEPRGRDDSFGNPRGRDDSFENPRGRNDSPGNFG